MSSGNVRTTVFLELQPTWSSFGEPRAIGMTVSNMTKKKPKNAVGPVIELELVLPAAAFDPLRPVVTIEVPESALDFTPEVTVTGVGDE